MNSALRLKRAGLLVRLRTIEHRAAAAQLHAGLQREARAAALADRTAALVRSYDGCPRAATAGELTAGTAMTWRTRAIHAEAELARAQAGAALETCRAQEHAARHRRDKAEDYRATLRRALHAPRAEPVAGRTRRFSPGS